MGFSPCTVKKKNNDNWQGFSRAVLGWAVPNFFFVLLLFWLAPTQPDMLLIIGICYMVVMILLFGCLVLYVVLFTLYVYCSVISLSSQPSVAQPLYIRIIKN